MVIDLLEAFEELKWTYEDHCKKRMKKIFDTFDLDANGYVEVDELFKTVEEELKLMMRELGLELIDKHLKKALMELDMNGDGAISFEEMRRWYFSGLKPYTSNYFHLLRLKSRLTQLS